MLKLCSYFTKFRPLTNTTIKQYLHHDKTTLNRHPMTIFFAHRGNCGDSSKKNNTSQNDNYPWNDEDNFRIDMAVDYTAQIIRQQLYLCKRKPCGEKPKNKRCKTLVTACRDDEDENQKKDDDECTREDTRKRSKRSPCQNDLKKPRKSSPEDCGQRKTKDDCQKPVEETCDGNKEKEPKSAEKVVICRPCGESQIKSTQQEDCKEAVTVQTKKYPSAGERLIKKMQVEDASLDGNNRKDIKCAMRNEANKKTPTKKCSKKKEKKSCSGDLKPFKCKTKKMAIKDLCPIFMAKSKKKKCKEADDVGKTKGEKRCEKLEPKTMKMKKESSSGCCPKKSDENDER